MRFTTLCGTLVGRLAISSRLTRSPIIYLLAGSKTKTIEDDILARVEARLSLVQSRGQSPVYGRIRLTERTRVGYPRSLSSGSMRPRSRKRRSLNRSSCERTKCPSQIADSDEDEEHVSVSNNRNILGGTDFDQGEGNHPTSNYPAVLTSLRQAEPSRLDSSAAEFPNSVS